MTPYLATDRATLYHAPAEQRAGRVLRPHPGKRPPVILDLVDADDKALSNRRSREVVYRRLNAERR